MGIVEGKGKMRLTKKRADNGRYYLSGLAEVLNSYPKGYGLIQVGHAVDKLAEYEDLEEQSRLLKLPCAVGDEFYCIWRNKGQNPIQKMQVKKIETHERKGIVIQMEFVRNRGCLFKFYEDDFGKTVFLTGEEAEAALKELERGKGK